MISVDEALQVYLDENGFTRASYDAPRTPASFLGVKFSVPNTPRHAWAIRLHDLHHVATGFGTDLAGEGRISAWEARRGLRPAGLYVGGIVATGALMGLVVAPRSTLRAWRAGRGGGGSLFHRDDLPYEGLLAKSVGELRALLALPAAGLQQAPRGLHSTAPKIPE